MSRAVLLDAVCRAEHGSNEWAAAVRALGRWRRLLDTPKRSYATGLSRGELFQRMLKSHVFNIDRAAWLSRWYASPNATTFDAMKSALETRKRAEKAFNLTIPEE